MKVEDYNNQINKTALLFLNETTYMEEWRGIASINLGC